MKMNDAAQQVQDEIDALVKKRDSLRGPYRRICGYCYKDDAPTFDEHKETSEHCHEMAWPCPLGIYESEHEKLGDGTWVSL